MIEKRFLKIYFKHYLTQENTFFIAEKTKTEKQKKKKQTNKQLYVFYANLRKTCLPMLEMKISK